MFIGQDPPTSPRIFPPASRGASLFLLERETSFDNGSAEVQYRLTNNLRKYKPDKKIELQDLSLESDSHVPE